VRYALSASSMEGSSVVGAAPTRRRFKLANAGFVEPLLHGDAMAGLSGIYAITNAIRLSLAHKRQLTAGEVHLLMHVGFRFLSGRLSPAQAFHSGCRVTLWRSLACAMVEAAWIRLGANLRIERIVHEPVDRSGAFDAIEQAVEQRRPVLMLRRGGSYTVVTGFTSASLLLFDSAGACWIAKHVCGVPGDPACENVRHMLYPASFIALSA
jgi:hypothetical protein